MPDVNSNLDLWSATASSNGPSGSTAIAAGLDDNLREIQAVTRKYLASKGADIASGSTVDLSAATGNRIDVTHSAGTTAITSLGTLTAGMWKLVRFVISGGTLTMTHNATSLKLPGAANVTLANGDCGLFVSLGSGNWECAFFQRNSLYAKLIDTDVTITVGTDYATLAAALESLESTVISTGATVTIALPSGTVSNSSPIAINHPCGAQINIDGATPVTTTATAAGAVTGSAGAWSVPLTVNSSVGISVNDYALIRNVTGTGRYKLFSGICKISAVSGATVTVTNTARNAAWPTATFGGADITVLKTIYSFTDCDGFQVDGPAGRMNNIAVVGNQHAGAIGIVTNRMALGNKQQGYIYLGPNVGVTTWGDGCVYAQYGGTIDAPYLCVANALTYNALAQHGGHLYMNNGISSGGVSSGGTGAGIAASNAGAVSAHGAISVGNATYGVWALTGGAVLVQDGYAWANLSENAIASWGGNIRGTSFNCQYGGGDGVKSVSGGSIVCPSMVTSNNAGVGAYAEGGFINCQEGVSNSNGVYGYYSDGGHINATSATATLNAINGFSANYNGTIIASGANGAGNTANSFSASNRGVIRATGANANAINADTYGFIDSTGVTGSPSVSTATGGVVI